MSFLIEQLKQLVTLLAAEKIPYALCGGLALAVHGKPRATVDIAEVTDIWEPREQRAWEFGDVCVVSREGLIKLKQISGRPNDLRDIENLGFGEE